MNAVSIEFLKAFLALSFAQMKFQACPGKAYFLIFLRLFILEAGTAASYHMYRNFFLNALINFQNILKVIYLQHWKTQTQRSQEMV